MLQEKARRVADALSLSQEDFKASNRWLDRFKNRNGIKAKCICKNERGYSRHMEETTSTYFTRMGAIWSMDETAQFFRALPSHVVARAQKSVWLVFFSWMPVVVMKSLSSLANQQIRDALGALLIKQICHADILINPKPGWKQTS